MSSILHSIESILGDEAESLLTFNKPKITQDQLYTPGPRFIEQVMTDTDRSTNVLSNLKKMRNHGRLRGSGYVSILPVDQDIEHSAGASFAKNPMYFDPQNIVELAIEGGCNAVTSSVGILRSVSKRFAHKIPFIAKINHNDLFRYPNDHDQIPFASVQQAYDLGAVGVGATIYFGSPESKRQIQEISAAFAEAHQKGMFTVLWCYVRNPAFTVNGVDYSDSADLTGQANHLGAVIGADIVKQKIPMRNGGYKVLNKGTKKYGKFDPRMYTELSSEHPIDLCRYQVLNGFAGRVGLISSGGPSGKDDFQDAIRSAVINKRAGGMGMILGRKAFQRPFEEGVTLLHTVQDVYLCKEITIV